MYSGQVLRGAVGRPIPDLLETLRQEYENMGQEISVFKAQRDEYERKRRPPRPPPSPARRTAPPTAPPPRACSRCQHEAPGLPPRALLLRSAAAAQAAACPRAVAGPRVPASAVCEGWGFGRRCPIRMPCKWGGWCIVFGIPAAGCSTPCSGCGRSDKLRLGGSGGAAAGNDRDERDA